MSSSETVNVFAPSDNSSFSAANVEWNTAKTALSTIAREGLAVYDPERESEVMENVQKASGEHLDSSTIRHIFERIIDETRRSERLHRSKSTISEQNNPEHSAD